MDWQESKNNPHRKMRKKELKDLLKDKSRDELIDDYINLYEEKEKINQEKEKIEKEFKEFKAQHKITVDNLKKAMKIKGNLYISQRIG